MAATKLQVEQLMELMRLVIDTPMEEYMTSEFLYALKVLRELAESAESQNVAAKIWA